LTDTGCYKLTDKSHESDETKKMIRQAIYAVGAGVSLFYLWALYHNNFKYSFTIDRSIEIDATPQNVLSFIVNKENYPLGMVNSWTGIEPEKALKSGEELAVGKIDFKVDLIKLGTIDVTLSHWKVKELPYRFGWVGVMVHKKLFSGDHHFIVSKSEKHEGKTMLIHRENITGLNTPMVRLWHEWTGYINYYTTYLEDVKRKMEQSH